LPTLYSLSLTCLTLTRLAGLSLVLATSTAPTPLGVSHDCGCENQDSQGAAHLY